MSNHCSSSAFPITIVLVNRLAARHHKAHMIPIEQHRIQLRLHDSLRCELAAYCLLLHSLQQHDICLPLTHIVVNSA
jgi:hypothetical protein